MKKGMQTSFERCQHPFFCVEKAKRKIQQEKSGKEKTQPPHCKNVNSFTKFFLMEL